MKGVVYIFIALCASYASAQFLNNRPFPTYSLEKMPDTDFSCRDKILGGYYADSETKCQMFHICVKVAGVGIQDFRFLCPNGTAFDQDHQICAEWEDVDCDSITLYYASDNFDLYRIGSGFESKAVKYGEEEETFALQRAETGDARLNREHQSNRVNQQKEQTYARNRPLKKSNQNRNTNGNTNNNENNNNNANNNNERDIFKSSSSSNFFNNRNGGKETDDDYDDNVNVNQNNDQVEKKKLVQKQRRPVQNQQQNRAPVQDEEVQKQQTRPQQQARPHQQTRQQFKQQQQDDLDDVPKIQPKQQARPHQQTRQQFKQQQQDDLDDVPKIQPKQQARPVEDVPRIQQKQQVRPVEDVPRIQQKQQVRPIEDVPKIQQNQQVRPIEDVPRIQQKQQVRPVEDVPRIQQKQQVRPIEDVPRIQQKTQNIQNNEDNRQQQRPTNQQQEQRTNRPRPTGFINNFAGSSYAPTTTRPISTTLNNEQYTTAVNNHRKRVRVQQTFNTNSPTPAYTISTPAPFRQTQQYQAPVRSTGYDDGQYRTTTQKSSNNYPENNPKNFGKFQQKSTNAPEKFEEEERYDVPKVKQEYQSTGNFANQFNKKVTTSVKNGDYSPTTFAPKYRPNLSTTSSNNNYNTNDNNNYNSNSNNNQNTNSNKNYNTNGNSNSNYNGNSNSNYNGNNDNYKTTFASKSSNSGGYTPVSQQNLQYKSQSSFSGSSTPQSTSYSQYTPTVPKITSTTPVAARSSRFDETQYDDDGFDGRKDDEFLKTAHSQNIASSRNELAKAAKQSTERPQYESPRPFAVSTNTQRNEKSTQAPPKVAPVGSKKAKDVSYDYAYYDTNVGSEPEYDIDTEIKKSAV